MNMRRWMTRTTKRIEVVFELYRIVQTLNVTMRGIVLFGGNDIVEAGSCRELNLTLS